MISRFIPFVEKEGTVREQKGGGGKGGSVVTENPKGGSLKSLEGFRGGTTQIRLENEDKRGGGRGSRKSSKVIRENHFSEVTFKGYSLI